MWLENPAVAHATKHGGWQRLLQGTSVINNKLENKKLLHQNIIGFNCSHMINYFN
jgi:hypothetical protein